jgi:hypothetical protein
MEGYDFALLVDAPERLKPLMEKFVNDGYSVKFFDFDIPSDKAWAFMERDRRPKVPYPA